MRAKLPVVFFLRTEARMMVRNPGGYMVLTGAISLLLWPLGITLRILYWMDHWGLGFGLLLRLAWIFTGMFWMRSHQNTLLSLDRARKPAGSGGSISAQSAMDLSALAVVPALRASHENAMQTLRARVQERTGGGTPRTPDRGEPYALVKEALLSPSGGVVPIGDPRARAATAYLHRASAGPNYLVARVDVTTGEYTEQPIDERHWRLVVG